MVKVLAILLLISALDIFEVDRLISLRYPFESARKFSGLISLQMISTLSKYSSIKMIVAA